MEVDYDPDVEQAWLNWRKTHSQGSSMKFAFAAGYNSKQHPDLDPHSELKVPYLASRLVEQKALLIDTDRDLEMVTAERDELLRRLDAARAALEGNVVTPIAAEPQEE